MTFEDFKKVLAFFSDRYVGPKVENAEFLYRKAIEEGFITSPRDLIIENPPCS